MSPDGPPQVAAQSVHSLPFDRVAQSDQTGAKAVMKKGLKKSWKIGVLKDVQKKGAEQEQTGAYVE